MRAPDEGGARATGVFEPIRRDRVIERLRLATRYPIALMIAPAGYGKSIALRQWLSDRVGSIIRYNVRAEHETLLGFVRGLVESLAAVAPKAIISLAAAFDGAVSPDTQARTLAVWLHEQIKDFRGLIVIDDLHVARNAPAVSIFLSDLIERSRESVRWFIATRDHLDLPIASWISYGYADLPIDATDLRFTLDEAKDAATTTNPGIDSAELAALLNITEGWATALAFSLRLSVRSAELSVIASGTRDMIFGYLAEQVFRTLPQQHRDFLLSTCVYSAIELDVLVGPGYDNAYTLVQELRRSMTFLYAESETVYRYHDLFREFLEAELKARGQGEYLATVTAAAQRLESAGRGVDALRLFVRARAIADIVRLLRHRGLRWFESGFADIIKSSLAAIPDDKQFADPVLLALRACFELDEGRPESAEAWLTRALTLEGDATQRVEIALRLAKGLYQAKGQRAVDVLMPLIGLSDVAPGTRGNLLGTIASACAIVGRIQEAASFIKEANAIISALDDAELQLRNLVHRAFIANLSGDFTTSARVSSEVAITAERAGFYRVVATAHGLGASCLMDGHDDYEQGIALLHQMVEAAAKGGWAEGQFHALSMLLFYETERGDDHALAALDDRIALFQSQSYFGANMAISPANAIRSGWRRDFDFAHNLLVGTAPQAATPQRRALRDANTAIFAAALGKREDACESLDAASALLTKQTGAESPTSHRAMKALLLCAIAYLILAQTASARHLLALVERNRSALSKRLDALLDCIRALYVEIETHHTTDDLQRSLARMRASGFGGYARLIEQLPFARGNASSVFAALTKAELAVLRALAKGASSKSIAQETGRSSQTVDAHVKAISRKLGCNGRREAIALARESGLFS